jgi:hypothetical protein
MSQEDAKPASQRMFATVVNGWAGKPRDPARDPAQRGRGGLPVIVVHGLGVAKPDRKLSQRASIWVGAQCEWPSHVGS